MNAIATGDSWFAHATSVAPLLFDAALKSVLVLVIAGGVVTVMRRYSAAARHLVWFLATATLLVLPLLSWCLPDWHVLPRWTEIQQPPAAVADLAAKETISAVATVPVQQRFDSIQIAPLNEALEPALPPPGKVEIHREPPPQPGRMTQVAPPWTEKQWGLLAWLVGAALALVPTALGLVSLRRLERASRPENALAWLQLLHWLLDRLRLRRRVALLKSESRRMPMTWGVLRPKLLLPEEAEEWPEERRRVVLLHELAHAKRWDYLTNLVTQLVCALYWFNPLVWIAARRMVVERERACDDIVLRHGAKPADYAEQILEIAAGLRLERFSAYGGIPMARPSKLEERLRAILDSTRNRAALTRLIVIGALALLAAIVIPIAMMRAAPADQPSHDTATELSGQDINPERQRSLLEFSDLIVAGEMVSNVMETEPATQPGVMRYGYQFLVTDVIKGSLSAGTIIDVDIYRMRKQELPPEFKRGDSRILCLNERTLNHRWWTSAADFAVQRADAASLAAWKRLANPTPGLVPGEVQLAELVRKYLPRHSLQEVTNSLDLGDGYPDYPGLKPALVTLEGKQIARVLFMRKRSLTGAPRPGEPSPYIEYSEVMKLLGPLRLKVPTATEAEDITRLALGLAEVSSFLEKWVVKAEPMGSNWLVTPSFIGPTNDQKYYGGYGGFAWWGEDRGAHELILENGVLIGIKQRTLAFGIQRTNTTQTPDAGMTPGWGQPVEGIQIHLHASRTRWGTNEEPALFVDVANRGISQFDCPTNYGSFEGLEIDGQLSFTPSRWQLSLA